MKPNQGSQPKQRIIHFVFKNPKYLKDDSFLKPCKPKRRKRSKAQKTPKSAQHDQINPNAFSQRVHAQQLNQFTRQERVGASTPSWAKLARARSIPNR
jgi:hypothetical protein